MSAVRVGRLLPWSAAGGWMGLIFYLSNQATPLGASATNAGATFAHLGLYAALALLLCWALAGGAGRPGLASGWPVAAVAFALAVLYGAVDEVHQAFVPGRSASEADLLLDALGALLGVSLAWSVATVVLKTRRTRP